MIDSRRADWLPGFRELFQSKDLLWMLAYRDFKIRYAQTALGILWAVIQPLLTLLIFILVFNKTAKIDSGNIPYPVFAMAGMWGWSYFAYVITQAGSSIIIAQSMVTKVYFPRLVIPLSKGLLGFIDFFISFLLLLLLLLFFQVVPSVNIIFLPFVILGMVMFSLALGIWLSALTIRFRDFQYVIPFIVQVGLYATPVAYPSSMIPPEYRYLFYLNPMTAILDSFRWSLLNIPLPETKYLLYSAIITLLLLASGIYYFRRTENLIADII